jgi:4-amino-4-deoxy-L-arabinose transferase-like glycosyltransferase
MVSLSSRPQSASKRAETTAPPRTVLLVFLIALLWFLAGTGTHSLFDSDEPRFAEASRDMMVRGDAMLPMLNGEPRLDKPILVYWLQILGYFLFGVGEVGARFPSALGLALAVAMTVRIGARIFGGTAGLLAGVVLATCLQANVTGRASTADGLLLGCVVVTIDALHRRVRGEKTVGTWLALWLGVAACGLAKGPPGWVAPGMAGIGAFLLIRRGDRLRGLAGGAAGVLLAIGLVLAWAIPVDLRTDGGIFSVALGKHVVGRAGGGVAGHGGWAPWWFLYYFGTVLLSFFPWSAWLPNAWRRWRDFGLDPRDRALLGWWIAGTFLLFTLVIGKRPHYVLPMFPALAVLVGGALVAGPARLTKTGSGFLLVVLVGSAAVEAHILTGTGFRGTFPGLFLLEFALLVLILSLASRPRETARAVTLAVGLVVVLFGGLMFLVLPGLERHRLVPQVAAALADAAPPGTKRVIVDFRPDGLTFYSQRDADGRLTTESTVVIERVALGKPLLALLRSGERVAVVMTEERRDRILQVQGLERLPGRPVWRGVGWYAKKSEWETVVIHVSP